MARRHSKRKVAAALSKKKKVQYKKDPRTGGYVKKRTKQDTYDLATKLAEKFVKTFGRKYPPASKAGEYPRRRTGRLRDSVQARVRGKTIEVGTYAPYAKYLAYGTRKMAPRKSAIDFAQEQQRKLPKYLSDLKIVGVINMRKSRYTR